MSDTFGLVLHALTSADAAALLAFYESLPPEVVRFYRPFDPVNMDVLLAHLREADEGRTLSLGLIGAGGRIVGHTFILGLADERPLFGIGLSPTAQGGGWGRRMTAAALAEADARGLPRVTLTVVKENVRARTLYEKMGFVVTGPATHRVQDDSLAMERARPVNM